MLDSIALRNKIGETVYKYMVSPHAGLERIAREMRKVIEEECVKAGGTMEGGKRITSIDKELIWLQGVEYGLQLLEKAKFASREVAKTTSETAMGKEA